MNTKIIYKKLVAMLLCLSMVIAASATVNASASETVIDYGDPIEVLTYIDEDGCQVTERIYFKPDNNSTGITLFSSSGSGWYKNEKELTWDNGLSRSTYYYAEGYFKWGDGDVSVSNASGGWDYIPSNATTSNRSLTSGTGRYVGIFNKYAYVTFSFTVTNVIGLSRDCSVTIRISESGNNI